MKVYVVIGSWDGEQGGHCPSVRAFSSYSLAQDYVLALVSAELADDCFLYDQRYIIELDLDFPNPDALVELVFQRPDPSLDTDPQK